MRKCRYPGCQTLGAALELQDIFKNRLLSGMAMDPDWEALIGGLGMGLRIEYSAVIFIMVLEGRVSGGTGGCDSCENAGTQGVKPLVRHWSCRIYSKIGSCSGWQ